MYFFIRLLEVENVQPDLTGSTNPSADKEILKKALEELEELKARKNCKVCLDKEVSFFCWTIIFYLLSYKVAVAFIPCAHLAACQPCAITLKVNLYNISQLFIFVPFLRILHAQSAEKE